MKKSYFQVIISLKVVVHPVNLVLLENSQGCLLYSRLSLSELFRVGVCFDKVGGCWKGAV
jgi:hypothetical protein